MSYISQEDYKRLMGNFQQGTPKGLLKEMHTMNHDGAKEHQHLNATKDEGLEKEGNAFTAGLAKAKKGQEFKVGGKTVKDTSNYDAPIKEANESLEKVFAMYASPLSKALAMRAKDKESVDAHDAVKHTIAAMAKALGLDPNRPYMEDEMFSGNYSPAKAVAHAKDMFTSELGEKNLEEYQFDDMYPEDPGPFEGEVEESHPGMDKWYEDFENGLQNLVKNGYIHKNMYQYFHDALDHIDPMQDYGHMPAHDAAKEFVDDLRTKDQMDADDYQWKQEHGGYDGGGDDFNDGEFWEAEMKKLQEIAGVHSQDDGPEDDNEEAREKRAHKAEEEDTEAENAEREIDEEETGENTNLRMPDKYAKLVAQKHSDDLKPLYDKYQAARKDPDHKVGNAAWKEYQNIAISWCGHEMLEQGRKRIEVSNILSGRGYHEDFNWEFMTALGEELKGVSENLNEGGNYNEIIPALKARGIKHAMPEKEIFKAIAEVMKELGFSDKEIRYDFGYDHDFLPDLLQALKDSEREMEEGLNEIGGHGDTPDNPKLQAAVKYLVQNRDKYLTQDYFFPQAISMLSLKSDEELYDYIINNWHSDEMYDVVAHMKSQIQKDMPGFGGTYDALDKISINEGSDYGKIIPALKARGIKYGMPEKEIIKAMAEVMKQEAGYTDREIRYYLGYEEDFIPDLLQALKDSEMEEGLHMPPLQATGNTVMTNEDQAPFGMSVLSPDERDQLKEYINHYRTIKSEISKLLEKAGKSGKIMENVKKAEDEKVPAERKAKYHNPTEVPKQHKHSNLGGNRTGLVMTKAEMWENEESEHERIEGMLDKKLHDAFHKVTGMIMKDLMADGFDEGDIKNFLQHEIDEKAKEAINAQHDF